MNPYTSRAKDFLFWQPPLDYLALLLSKKFGRQLFVFLNFFIWPYLFYLSVILTITDPNIFWQIFIAMFISVFVEYLLKSLLPWKRPITKTQNFLPFGIHHQWALKGSFPSGHTAKTLIFFLFILQYGVHSPLIFILINVPLVLARIFLGFHYPVDIFGGLLTGFISWLFTHQLIFPSEFTDPLRDIFKLVF
ncbi:MAG: phosphatase PAP2 family protein [Patescibacteria group bacterium]|jgi:membrane-associated phospholipid phosphatase